MEDCGVLSVDFLLSIMMIMLIFSGLVNIISDRTNLVNENDKLSQSRILVEKISSALNKVYCGGFGQKITINLPEKIENSTYLIKIRDSSVYIELEGKIGKTQHYPMLIIDSKTGNTNEIIMHPGKTYTIANIPLNNSSAVTMT